MKNLKLLFIAVMVLLYAKSAQSACNASFTKSISGLTVTFTNTSTTTSGFPNMMTYSWSFGDGTFSTLKNPVKTYATGGVKGVQLFINDSMGCTHLAIDTFILVATPPPCTAAFSKSISGLTVALTNQSVNTGGTPAGLSYFWQFSDGTSSTATNLSKTFASGGFKTIRLTINDTANTCNATRLDTVFLTAPISCNASFTKAISGLSVAFTNTSSSSSGSNAINYTWNFSDGTSSNLKNPTKVFGNAGTKTAQLSMYDSATSCTSTTMDTFVLGSGLPPCSAAFVKTISGLNVTLSNLSVNSIGTTAGLIYNWTFSDGTGSTQKNLTKTFATGGYKTIQLNIIDSANTCISSKRDSFNLSSTPCQANFTKTVSGLTATINNTSLNGNGNRIGLAYTWVGSFVSSFPNGNHENPILTFSNLGPQFIGLFIYDSVTNCTSSKSDSFNLVSPTVCNANFSKTISGLTVSFNNTSINSMGLPNGLLFDWSFSDSTTSTARNPVKTFASAGLKTIKLTITDTTGAGFCTSTKYDTVFLVAPAPLCSASYALAVDTTTPFSFFLLNTSLVRPASTFYWTFGDGGSSTSMTPTHSYATFGKYRVCLTVSDSLCTSTYCDSIGMDSLGNLLKKGGFSFRTLDFTKLSGSTGQVKMAEPMQYLIYPNPSVGELTVEVNLKEATLLSFEITDISGKLLATKSIQHASGNVKESLDLSELKPSIYFLNIKSNEGLSTHKIIKN